MDLSTITVFDFKSFFTRDFPYLPVWSSTAIYNAGTVVYYTDGLFYKAKVNGVPAGTLPTNTTYFELIDDSVLNYVLDPDITKAFQEAQISFNQALFTSDDNIKLGYLYLTAHYLVNDLRTAQAGLGSTGEFTASQRSVGNVSEAYAIPEVFAKDPMYAFYIRTGYGLKYLNLILPKLVGNIGVVYGGTNP